MNAASAKHPTAELLAGFLHGRLTATDQTAVETHIAGCAECCKKLEGLPVDTLAEQVRGIDTHGEVPSARPPATVPPELADHPRYRVIRPLGAGGMGAVFLAEHRRMERMVALKVIHPELLNHPNSLERFEREVKSAGRLAHPNIVAAHDADAAGAVHFLVMEYVDGASLARIVEKRGPLPVAHACHYARQAALGLQHAHEMGMIHRDVKPQNLMLAKKGQIKIVDFGLACLASFAGDQTNDGGTPALGRGLTQAGAVVGTPDYMAPEQIDQAADIDVRADIYSLGCTLAFLLTGRPPFRGANANQTLDNHRRGRRTPIREANPDVPEGLAQVIDRMLEKNPLHRYQTPVEVAAALAPFTKAPPKDADETVVVRPRKRLSRRTTLAIGAAGLVATIAIGVAAMQSLRKTPNVDAPAAVAASAVSLPVLVVVPQEFYAAEYRAVADALRDAKVPMKIASSSLTPCRPLDNGEPITPQLALPGSPITARDFAGVVLVGGYVHAFKDDRPSRQALWDVLKEMNAANKPVAAADSGLVVLSVAGQLKGKSVARSSRVAQFDQLRPSGAKWMDQPSVVDGTLYTAASSEALPALMSQFARQIKGQ